MQLIMLGTGPFAVPTFRELLDARHAVAALITSPLRAHRGRPLAPASSIRALAEQRGVPIFDPEDVNAPEFRPRLAGFGADLLMVCDYGQILSPATLSAARHGGVNLHASLLPKYRGAAPINWAIYNGDTETGVTVIHMTPRIDAGPCIAQSRVDIAPDETAAELEDRLAEIGARLVCESIDRIISGDARPLPQDPALATKAPRLKKTDGALDWTRPAAAIRNHVRAMEPWPKTYTYWHRPDGPPLRVIFGPLSVVENRLAAAGTAACNGDRADVPSAAKHNETTLPQLPPGTVIEATGDRLVIAAGHCAVAPAAIQPAGKRPMTVAEFLRGHKVRQGDRFGPEIES